MSTVWTNLDPVYTWSLETEQSSNITVHTWPCACFSKVSSRPLWFRFCYCCITSANIQYDIQLDHQLYPTRSVGHTLAKTSTMFPTDDIFSCNVFVRDTSHGISIYTTKNMLSNASQTTLASGLRGWITIHVGGSIAVHLWSERPRCILKPGVNQVFVSVTHQRWSCA